MGNLGENILNNNHVEEINIIEKKENDEEVKNEIVIEKDDDNNMEDAEEKNPIEDVADINNNNINREALNNIVNENEIGIGLENKDGDLLGNAEEDRDDLAREQIINNIHKDKEDDKDIDIEYKNVIEKITKEDGVFNIGGVGNNKLEEEEKPAEKKPTIINSIQEDDKVIELESKRTLGDAQRNDIKNEINIENKLNNINNLEEIKEEEQINIRLEGNDIEDIKDNKEENTGGNVPSNNIGIINNRIGIREDSNLNIINQIVYDEPKKQIIREEKKNDILDIQNNIQKEDKSENIISRKIEEIKVEEVKGENGEAEGGPEEKKEDAKVNPSNASNNPEKEEPNTNEEKLNEQNEIVLTAKAEDTSDKFELVEENGINVVRLTESFEKRFSKYKDLDGFLKELSSYVKSKKLDNPVIDLRFNENKDGNDSRWCQRTVISFINEGIVGNGGFEGWRFYFDKSLKDALNAKGNSERGVSYHLGKFQNEKRATAQYYIVTIKEKK